MPVDPLVTLANWFALKNWPATYNMNVTMNGVRLSSKSIGLLYADISWLMVLFNKDI
jgi:hypothetical protein